MEITFTRGGEHSYSTVARRDDGVTLLVPSFDRTHSMPHDLAHFVVERELTAVPQPRRDAQHGRVRRGGMAGGRPSRGQDLRGRERADGRGMTPAAVLRWRPHRRQLPGGFGIGPDRGARGSPRRAPGRNSDSPRGATPPSPPARAARRRSSGKTPPDSAPGLPPDRASAPPHAPSAETFPGCRSARRPPPPSIASSDSSLRKPARHRIAGVIAWHPVVKHAVYDFGAASPFMRFTVVIRNSTSVNGSPPVRFQWTRP